MKTVAKRKTLARQIAEESAKHVLSESTRAAIDKMAEEFARDMLADKEFREHLRREATAAAREIARALREADPELHGAG
jgi:cobalamin biosynthesis Mg chelatase CobN